jgi:hypothetical protein
MHHAQLYPSGLFNDAINNSDDVALNDILMMKIDYKGYGRKKLWLNL